MPTGGSMWVSKMKKLALVLLLLSPVCLLAQGIRFQSFTTNNGTIVTNIVKSLATNVVTQNGGGAGGWTGNANQFSVAGGVTNIKSGAILSNTAWINPTTGDSLQITNPADAPGGYTALWFKPGTAQADIWWGDPTKATPGATIRYNPNHPHELEFAAYGTFSFSANYGGISGSTPHQTHFGASGPNHDPYGFQYDLIPDAGTPLGYSKPLSFAVRYFSGGGHFKYPNIWGVARAANATGYILRFGAGPNDGIESPPTWNGTTWESQSGVGDAWLDLGYQAQFYSNVISQGYIIRSNAFPITSLDQLGNSGCVYWNSNGTVYLICTNSRSGTLITNASSGGAGLANSYWVTNSSATTGWTNDVNGGPLFIYGTNITIGNNNINSNINSIVIGYNLIASKDDTVLIGPNEGAKFQVSKNGTSIYTNLSAFGATNSFSGPIGAAAFVGPLYGAVTAPSITVTGALPGTVVLNDANGGLRLQLGTNDNIFGTNASTAWIFSLTNGGATFSSNVVAAKYFGDGSALTGISGGTGIATNNGTGTNNVFTGFTADGSNTNAPGTVHTGGRVETNYSTKSFISYSNAAILSSNGVAIRAGTFFMTNTPTQSLLYLGTNPPSSGLATAIANGALGSTNLLQIDAPNINAALAVHTNGGVWIGQGLTNNGTTRLVGAVQISGQVSAISVGAITMGGNALSGNAYSVLFKTANYTISQFTDSGKIIDNAGAGGAITNTLPSANSIGLNYRLFLETAQMMGFKAAGSDVFVDATLGVSAAAATLTSSTLYGYIELVCIDSGKWAVINSRGTWTY
jgi:hypothetical protein